ncbi:MAG: DUF6049 family protein [Microthrixaceae bacterium]
MRAPLHLRTTRAGLALLTLCWAIIWATTVDLTNAQASPNGVQQQPADGLRISSVSPWVTSDGEFQVRFDPTSAIPPGALLTYTVHQALQPTRQETLRERVDGVINGSSAGKVLQTPNTRPLAEYGEPTTGSVLTIPIRSTATEDRLRLLLPKAGIHPVELVVTSAEGPEIWSQVVFLNRLPSGYTPVLQDPSSVVVTLLMPIETAPSIDSQGVAQFSLEDRARIGAATTLLETVPDAPIRLGLRPNTLDGLVRSKEPWAERFVNALNAALADTDTPTPDPPSTTPSSTTPSSTTPSSVGPSIFSLPYVQVNTAGLISAGGQDDLLREITLGNRVTQQITAHSANRGTWVLDDSLSQESAVALGELGVKTFLVAPSQLARSSNLDEQQTMTAAVQLGKDSGLRALAYDTLLAERAADSQIDPALRAHQIVSLMISAWFSARSTSSDGFSAAGPALGSAILLPTNSDPELISSLSASLLSDGPLQIFANATVLGAASPNFATPVSGLVPQIPPDERLGITETTETRRQVNAFRSMTTSPESDVELWTRLNAQSLSSQLDTAQRTGLHNAVRTQIANSLAQVEFPPARQVTLTGRSSNIPLRFRNNLPYAIRVKLTARSTRLEITGDDAQELLLAPGENRIDLPVTVQAPGESYLQIKILSPDEEIEIGQLELPVRATAISGVGAALSVISILFLMLWWAHAHRRRRREAARSSGDHPAQANSR